MALGGAQMGYTIAFCPDPYAVAAALPAVRPTVFPSVPRVYEKIHTGLTQKFAEEKGVKRALAEVKSRCLFLKVLGSYPAHT